MARSPAPSMPTGSRRNPSRAPTSSAASVRCARRRSRSRCGSRPARCRPAGSLGSVRQETELMSLTCGDLIKRGRALYGDQLALQFEGRTFTFAEQAARMFRLANALLAKGLRKRERVAILDRNCSEYVEIFGACEVAGFVAIKLNSRLAQAELAAICQDSQPAVLIFAKDFAKEAQAI